MPEAIRARAVPRDHSAKDSETRRRGVLAGRVDLLALMLVLAVVAGACLRIVLALAFHGADFGVAVLAACLVRGALHDAFAAGMLLVPFALAVTLVGCRWLARPRLRQAFLTVVCALVVFEALVEYRFFEEFDARYNNIAIDYVIYPGEVAGNVWESYDVPLHVAAALIGGALIGWVLERRLAGARFDPLPWRTRASAAAGALVVGGFSLAGTLALPRDLAQDRVTNEIAANGPVELVRAFWSDDLEFSLYYRTLPEADGRVRASHVLGFEPVTEPGGEFTVEKHVTAAGSPPPSQIVVVLEESLGSEFVGALGGKQPTLTPELERHFADGVVLTNLIANGNRTVRGLEGVLCSFVPLPGYAVLRRGKSENVATLARVLAAHGYETVYFYGGSGTFDGMEPFLAANGWDELVTDPDYPDDEFRTAWGVADEFVFDALLARQVEAHASGRPLFATMLSVSNHRPYDVPSGRYALPADLHGRAAAVRYADACIGGYLDGLRERGLLDDTLVLIVGDHGPRVYGAEQIPIESYRIPALFVTPDARRQGKRIDRLCSQIDLGPTLLALAGIDYTAPFLGESVLDLPADGGRAFVQHDRDVGMLTDDALVVLGLQKTVAFYTRIGRESDTFTRVPERGCARDLLGLADDASAVFQSAYELYEQRRFRMPADLARP